MPLRALSDESICRSGDYECTDPHAGDYNYFGGASSCSGPQPALPRDPIGTFASASGGGGQGFSSEGGAAGFTNGAYKCLFPVGSSVEGRTVCGDAGYEPAGPWVGVTFWSTPGRPIAYGSRYYRWKFKVLNPTTGECTAEHELNSKIFQGNYMACPPNHTNATDANGNYFCARIRVASDCCGGSNPIWFGTHEKRQTEQDYLGQGPFPLRIVRHYSSQALAPGMGESGSGTAPFGLGWRTEYHASLSVLASPLGTTITMRRSGGDNRVFLLGTGNALTGLPDEKGTLERLTDGSGNLAGWAYRAADESIERYRADGKLASITNPAGQVQSMAYDASGRLETVTDPLGRSLEFQYGADGRIDTIVAPGSRAYRYAYTGSGALETVTYPDSRVRRYHYEADRLPWSLTGITDENLVRRATYRYDAVTGKATSTEWAGGANRYSVSSSTPVVVTDPLLTQRTYVFSPITSAHATFLVERRQPNLNTGSGYTTETYGYDANGNQNLRTDDEGRKTKYTFDPARNLEVQRIEGFGAAESRTITTQWHAARRLPLRIAEPLRITTYTYNEPPGACADGAATSAALVCSRNVQGTTDANGSAGLDAQGDGTEPRVWRYRYTASGLLSSVDGPRTDVNDTTTYQYYASSDPGGDFVAGDLQAISNPLGHVTRIARYDADGRATRIVDPNGLETLLDYSPRGWLLSRGVGSAATGFETTTYDYDFAGQLLKVTLPDTSFIEYGYDDAHRLVSMRDGLGNRIAYTLDAAGNRTSEQAFDTGNTLARAHTREFDALGRLFRGIGGTNPASQVTTHGYDATGNLVSVLDPLNRSTTQTFDARNRMTQSRDPFNGAASPTRYVYNGQDQLVQVVDPKGLATTYSVNGHGELLAQSSPDTGTTGFSYDLASNLKSRLDARGIQADYAYDELNRITRITYPDETVAYSYDACANGIGRLCAVSDRTGTTAWAYDLRGRVTSKTQTVGALAQTVSYAYNAAGQLAAVTTPAGQVVEYGYANNRPVSVRVNGTTVLDQAFYEPFGPNGGWRWGNSTGAAPNFHTRLFDNDFRLQGVESDLPLAGAAKVIGKAFAWDAASRIASIADLADAALSATYGHDSLDRLTSAGQGASAWGYTFDGVGNRMSSTVNGASTAYGYVPGSHRLESLSGAQVKSYTFDAAGNMASDGTAAWIYGGHNRPTQVQVGATLITFAINALGQRVRKTTGSSATRFVYDESGRLMGEYSDAGALVAETIWLDELPVAVVKAQPAAPAEQTIDNAAPGFSTTGTWAASSSVAGYQGTNYLTHAPGADAIGALVVDNTDAGFGATGTWGVSTSVAGYLGANYRTHAANGEPPSAIVVDNESAVASATGTWPASTGAAGFLGTNYQNHAGGTGANAFTWTASLPAAGSYQAWARWTASTNRATNATYTVATAAGNQAVAVNQQANGGTWQLLGTWAFEAGSTSVTLTDQANGYVIADAVMFVPAGAQPSTATWQASLPSAGNWRVSARWPAHPNRATNATFRVQTPGGTIPVTVNQQANGGAWTILGTYAFDAGTTAISLDDQADGYVIADAVKFEPEGALPESAVWTPALTGPARFDVYAKWTALSNRSAAARYVVTHQGGTASLTQNQQANGATWNLLGTWTFAPGQGVRLEASDGGYVIADAVRFVPSADQPSTGGLFYVHPDHLGTPRAITRPADNALVWRWENAEPFGNSAPSENPSGLGTFAYNLRFPGQYYDQETGTHYNYYRDFDPAIGRYIQSDPIGLRGGINTYAYVNSRPLDNADPYGLQGFAPPLPVPLPTPGQTPGLDPQPTPGWSLPEIEPRDWLYELFSDRSIPRPAKPSCGCTCICRADANDNIPGNVKPGDIAFAFGQATDDSCAKASKEAKRIATRNLGKQPKHVGCRCVSS